MDMGRRKRSVFTHTAVVMGALSSLSNVEETGVMKDMDRKKRSEFTDGLLSSGEKLVNGSPGWFFVEILKTIAKPVYNWVIGTDNDDVMHCFTTRMLPETQFHGHLEEYKIASHT